MQLYHGAGSRWDAHARRERNHEELCAQMDKPVAGLIRDVPTCKELIDRIMAQAEEIIRGRLGGLL